MSPDFREHVVGQNLLPLLREHDHRQMEIFCYANMIQGDPFTEQIRRYADVWHGIAGLSDSQAADLIRQDQIDILVDLALHTAGNRLLVFARKPAPVQVSYLGYCSSTGLETMDYRLSDPHLDPPDSDLSAYSEGTIHLPETYWCFNNGGPTPEPGPPPVEAMGFITFGCLNNFAKVPPRRWTFGPEILQSVPRSRLIIHSPSGKTPGCGMRAICRQRCFSGPVGIRGQATVASIRGNVWPDRHCPGSIPLGRGITTCDALWMGVPVVSLVGRTAVGRGGAKHSGQYRHAGIDCAFTPEDYLAIAVGLAERPAAIGRITSNPASADAGVSVDGCAAICPQYRSGVSADVAEFVRGMTNRAVAHIKSGVSPAVLEKLLRDLPRNGTRIKDRGYRQVWRFEFEGQGYYLKFYPRRGMRLKRLFRGSRGDAGIRPAAGDAARRGAGAAGDCAAFGVSA